MVFKKVQGYSSTKELQKKSLKKGFYISPLQAPWKKQQRSQSGELLKKLGGLNFQNLATEVSVVEILRNLKKDPTPNSTPPVSFWPGLHAARPCRTELEEVNEIPTKSSTRRRVLNCMLRTSENDGRSLIWIVFAHQFYMQKCIIKALPKLCITSLLWCRTKEFPGDGSGLSCKTWGLKVGEGHCNGKQIKKTRYKTCPFDSQAHLLEGFGQTQESATIWESIETSSFPSNLTSSERMTCLDEPPKEFLC